MSKKANATAKHSNRKHSNRKHSNRNGNIVLGLCKPLTGGKAKGWALCEVTRTTFRLIGEQELCSILNGSKCTLNEEIITSCRKGLDLGHALSVGIKLARKLNYLPCKALSLYGDGATKLVNRLDDAKVALKVFTDKTASALKALLESKEKNRNELFKAYQKAVKTENDHREIYNKAVKKYNADCATATALLTMNDLRKA